ncbi:hypothetical protein IEQ34_001154 [Dendrobium chrysotoxum]|uniref:Uncharacterized protein n=1 Tax=Dendrobium chrysotoxum TaxID=161865 RepID=A0AAV7HLS7_DENCH|nr:hypothetical protein IEQ34_001154 [Dendrobium chrysotoxum]
MPQLNLLNNFLKIFTPNKALHPRIMNWIVGKLSLKHETKLYIGWWTIVNEIFTLQMHQSAYATEEITKIIISYVQKCLLAVSTD